MSLSPKALGDLRLALFTACGSVWLPQGDKGFQSKMFHGNIGDTANRSWNGFVSGGRGDRPDSPVQFFERMPAAWRGDRRAPGVDIISRAGTVTYEPGADDVSGR